MTVVASHKKHKGCMCQEEALFSEILNYMKKAEANFMFLFDNADNLFD
jgi:CO dehydrogenase nickel-insertion accessory protein CooC1